MRRFLQYARRARAAFVCGMLLIAMSARATTESDRSAQIKAAAVYYLAQFVRWPVSVLPEDDSPLTICTLGSDPLFEALEPTLKSKKVGEHPIVIRQANGGGPRCHLLFLGTTHENGELKEALSTTDRALTVGPEGFVELGGMIELLEKHNKLKIKISRGKVTQKELSISSELLEIAEVVN